MEFIGEYKILELGKAGRFVTITGERIEDKGLYFITSEGEEIFVGNLKYISNDTQLWRVTSEREIIECDKDLVGLVIQEALVPSAVSMILLNKFILEGVNSQVEVERAATDSMREERDLAKTILRDAQTDLKAAEAKVAELEKEIVELKKTPKAAKKKAEETTDAESERLPSGSEEK